MLISDLKQNSCLHYIFNDCYCAKCGAISFQQVHNFLYFLLELYF